MNLDTSVVHSNFFAVDVAIWHPELDPDLFSSLSFPVLYSWKSGEKIGGLTKRLGHWRARIAEGSEESDFQVALQSVVQGLEPLSAHFLRLKKSEAQLEVILKFNLHNELGKLLEIELGSEFLHKLAAIGFSIKLECFGSDGEI